MTHHRAIFDALRSAKAKSREEETQECIDTFYAKNGPCCAGCDWWRWHNAACGECIKSAPVSGEQRIGLLGIRSPSLPLHAGHPLTPRDHYCGDFQDTEQGQ